MLCKLKVWLLTALWLLALPASAAQVLNASGDETLVATITRSEPTLLRLEGHPIRRVFGGEGEFTFKPDKESGTAYILPTTDKAAITLFVADHVGNTVKLLLAVGDGPSDTIVVKGLAPRKTAREQSIMRDLPRNHAIKQVVLALATATSSDLEERRVNRPVPLWNEARFVLARTVDTGELKGEHYTLTNVSPQPMMIDERELYRRGVLAVSVEKPNLLPGETTAIYIVTEGAQ